VKLTRLPDGTVILRGCGVTVIAPEWSQRAAWFALCVAAGYWAAQCQEWPL
jgi:hypothetical protein